MAAHAAVVQYSRIGWVLARARIVSVLIKVKLASSC